jgi:hypothetical protein
MLAVLMTIPSSVLAQSLSGPTVVRVRINQGDASRSAVTNMAVTFSTNVAIAPPGLVLQHLSAGTNLPAANIALSYNPASNQATWTFPGLPGGSLPDGNWFGSLLSPAIINLAARSTATPMGSPATHSASPSTVTRGT